jgi:hypothetical protein
MPGMIVSRAPNTTETQVTLYGPANELQPAKAQIKNVLLVPPLPPAAVQHPMSVLQPSLMPI